MVYQTDSYTRPTASSLMVSMVIVYEDDTVCRNYSIIDCEVIAVERIEFWLVPNDLMYAKMPLKGVHGVERWKELERPTASTRGPH